MWHPRFGAIEEKQMLVKSTLGAALAATLLSSGAYAQSTVVAWTELNLRAGPGPQFPIISVIPANGEVMVDGCHETASWCKVTHAGALLHKSGDRRTSPFPGQTYPMASVTGMPSAVKPFMTATRTWNSAT